MHVDCVLTDSVAIVSKPVDLVGSLVSKHVDRPSSLVSSTVSDSVDRVSSADKYLHLPVLTYLLTGLERVIAQ